MSNPDSLDDLFQRPLELRDNDEMTAEIMRKVARVERQRRALLVCSGIAGAGIAGTIVMGANVLPAISSGTLPTVGSYFERLAAGLSQYVVLEPLPSGFGLWMLAAASLIAMGLAAARFIHEP